MPGRKVAVVGATGAVGVEMLKVLEARSFPVSEIRLLASARSTGRRLAFRGADLEVEELTPSALRGVEIALFSAGSARSRAFAPDAAREGTVVVDNSSAFRMDPEVPLVVPEINGGEIRRHKGIIANPNCTTIILLMAVHPIHRAARVRRIIVSSYQAVSGAGAKAIAELAEQTRASLDGRPLVRGIFPHPIAFNLFPQVGEFAADGYCEEEIKVGAEARKILGDPAIRVSATTVRVPVFRAHSEAVHLETERKVTAAQARELLGKAEGVEILDDPKAGVYPTPLQAAGKGNVLVGRIREDASCENGLVLWVAGDQLLKGAALNAVQIAERL